MNRADENRASGDTVLQDEWDTLRLNLFIEVMQLHIHDDLQEIWQRFRIALTDAFDRILPVYPVYRQLRTFAIAHWPVLKKIVDDSGQTPEDIVELAKIIQEVTQVLEHALDERMKDHADQLETEMDLLRTLLATDKDLHHEAGKKTD